MPVTEQGRRKEIYNQLLADTALLRAIISYRMYGEEAPQQINQAELDLYVSVALRNFSAAQEAYAWNNLVDAGM